MPQADLYLRICANRACGEAFTTQVKTDRLCVDCEFLRWTGRQKATKRPPAKPIIVLPDGSLAQSEAFAKGQHDLPKRRLG